MTGRSRWRLDGLAFTIAVEAMGRDRLPYPFAYQPRRMDHMEEWQQLRMRTAQRLQEVFDQDLHAALAVLLEPEIRIEVHGYHGPEQSQRVRIHAGFTSRAGTLAIQLPGPTPESGGDVLLVRGSVAALPTAVVTNLPKFPPGTHREFSGRRTDFDKKVYARHPVNLSEPERLQRFFRRPRIGLGEITVYPGAAIDARPTDDGHAFFWLDYPDDGRYILDNTDAEQFTVSPGPDSELVHQLKRRITTVHRRRTSTP